MIDEAVLKKAVEQKFPGPARNSFEGYLDKVFFGYIRLPPMEASEFEKVSRLLLRSDEINAAKAAWESADTTERRVAARPEQLKLEIAAVQRELNQGPPQYKTVKWTERSILRLPAKAGGPLEFDKEVTRDVLLTKEEQEEWKNIRRKRLATLEEERNGIDKLIEEKK